MDIIFSQYVRWSQQCRLLDVFHSMLFLARAKLDILLIDALLYKDHTREHFNHFSISMIMILLNKLNRLSSNSIASNVKCSTFGTSSTAFYTFLKLLFVCVVSFIVSFFNHRPCQERCWVSPSLPPTVTTKETRHISRQGVWLESETIDNTTQTISLTLIIIEARCHRNQWQ